MSVAKEFFETELELIEHGDIRHFTEYLLNKAPAYFWLVPSSSTGKWHPPQENGTGGLVRHSKAVAYFAERLCRAYAVEGRDKDLILSACVSHDICKYGLVMQKHTTKTHGTDGANYILNMWKQFVNDKGELPEQDVLVICRGVAHHMGRWTINGKKFPEEYTTSELIVHLADMMAASSEVSLGFLQESLIG